MSVSDDFFKNLDVLIRSRYPYIYLLSYEEERVESLLEQLVSKQNKELYIWSSSSGLYSFDEYIDTGKRNGKVLDSTEVLQFINSHESNSLFLLKDFHPFFDDPFIIRTLRDYFSDLKNSYKNIIFLSPDLNLPLELEKEVTVLDLPLPSVDDLFELLKSICKTLKKIDKSTVQISSKDGMNLAKAAQGLTLIEAENVFSKAVIQDKNLKASDVKAVLNEKEQIIRKSNILEFYNTETNLSDVGGIDLLKKWLKIRSRAFEPKAKKFGLSLPKGVLLLGAPGCGKSLMAKAVSNLWNMPLLRLDFGKIFSGLVGSSEENMRKALKVAEGIQPVILWIDEIEKGLAGTGSGKGESDGGTSARVFGTFLTWMQEKKSMVFVIATANKINMLPPELLRRGRFDEIFFMDLPTSSERKSILDIHLKKRNRDIKSIDTDELEKYTQGFSGAEIEYCVNESLFYAYDENRELVTSDLVKAFKNTVPLSITYKEQLEINRNWAKNRARFASSSQKTFYAQKKS